MRLLAGVLTDLAVELQTMVDAWRLAPDDDPGWTWPRENPLLAVGNPNARIDYLYCGLDSTGALARIVDVGLFGVGPGSTGSGQATTLASGWTSSRRDGPCERSGRLRGCGRAS